MSKFTPRQKQIIAVAIELIAEKGIQHLTIKNIAHKIGLAEGAIYRHFESKMDILIGVLKMFGENKDHAFDEINAPEISPLQKLERLFKERFTHFTNNPALAAVIFSEEIFQNDKRLSDEVLRILTNSQHNIQAIIIKGQEAGQFRRDISAEQLSLLIAGALRLIVTKWRLSGFSFDLQVEGEKLWNSLNKIVTS
jgi:AcrR family transcriptional regulator